MNTSIVSKYLVDTHTLIWYLQADQRLGKQAQTILLKPSSQLVIPLLVLVEAALVIERGRTSIPSFAALLEDIGADQRIEVYDLTFPIFQRSLTLIGQKIPELHDRLIVSTGLYLQNLGHTVAILTRDEEITQARVLPVIW